jgi:hypothetical protein
MTDFNKEYAAWTVTKEEAKQIGDRLGLDWDRFPIEEFRKGVEVEFEHTSDIMDAARIAIEHLAESETYYSDLESVENEKISEHRRILLSFLRKS